MKAVDQPLIFAGFPKTGSKWLLNSLWLSSHCRFKVFAQGQIVKEDFIENNQFSFDPDFLRQKYDAFLRECSQHEQIPVLHHEGLLGSLFSNTPPSTKPIQQIADVFPGARIILFVREQKSILHSWYAHNVRLGRGASVDNFFRETDHEATPFLRYDLFYYDNVVRYLYDLFGTTNVLVLPYELLKKSPNEFVSRIATFCKCDIDLELVSTNPRNVGLSALDIQMLCRINSLFATDHPLPRKRSRIKQLSFRTLRSLARVVPKKFTEHLHLKINQKISSYVGERYCSSNWTLQQLTGIDFESFEYSIASPSTAQGKWNAKEHLSGKQPSINGL